MVIAKTVISLGTISIITNQIVDNIARVPFMLASSFGTVTTIIAGIKLGEKQEREFTEYNKQICKMAIMFSIIFIVVFMMFGKNVIALYTKESEVSEFVFSILSVYVLIIPLQAISVVIASIFKGLGKTKITSMVSIVIFVIIRPTMVTYQDFISSLERQKKYNLKDNLIIVNQEITRTIWDEKSVDYNNEFLEEIKKHYDEDINY